MFIIFFYLERNFYSDVLEGFCYFEESVVFGLIGVGGVRIEEGILGV